MTDSNETGFKPEEEKWYISLSEYQSLVAPVYRGQTQADKDGNYEVTFESEGTLFTIKMNLKEEQT